MPKELQDFNWAAFFLTFIWGLKFKAPITFLAIPLILIQMPLGLNWILLALLQLYCGIKGNEWAYKQEYWKKSKDFRITQMKWAVVAIAFCIIVPILILSVCARFLKNTYNLPELLQNSQCITAYKIAKKDIKHTDITSTTSNYEILNQIAKKYPKSSYSHMSFLNPISHYSYLITHIPLLISPNTAIGFPLFLRPLPCFYIRNPAIPMRLLHCFKR